MRTLLASLFVLMLAFPATAAFEGPDAGASSDSADCQSCEVNTVARALRAADDTPCVLEGLILSRLPQKEHYRFQDSSGVIPVDIDDELFAGRKITPEDRVRLTGEVDVNDCGDREIDVEKLELL